MRRIIIITFCSLLLIAYLFDISSKKTKIPSVVLLILLGWVVKQATVWLELDIPNLTDLLPFLGSVGLMLIVLEGSLELQFKPSKYKQIRLSFFGALGSILAMTAVLAFLFHVFGNIDLRDSLEFAIPFCVISSAIAIPSSRELSPDMREFVVYESSFSDILGVLILNFLIINETIDVFSFGTFALQVLIILLISIVSTIVISKLLHDIKFHIKFIPIILMVLLIYNITRHFELPGLIFILIFGFFVGNSEELKERGWLKKLKLRDQAIDLKRFKEFVIELAFIIRALFFILFGYLIEKAEVLNKQTIEWALIIVGTIFIVRFIQLKISKLPQMPLLFMAPRGLITTQLFLIVAAIHPNTLVNKSLVIQIIIMTSLIMMIGLIFTTRMPVNSSSDSLDLQQEGVGK